MNNPLIAARDAFAQAHPETRVTVNGRTWGVTRVGETGPALVLIPGTLGHGDLFWQQIERLGGRARIVALTYPASGGIAEWTEDVCALMDDCGFASASVLGSSLGGYLVQYIAATHPERVQTLFAANTLSSSDEIAVLPQYAAIDDTPLAALRAGISERLAARGAARPDQKNLVELLMREANERIPEQAIRTRLRALRYAPEIPAITLPRERIVTIESDDDPMISPPMRERVRARLNPGRSHRFAAGGHFPYVTVPDEYSALLEDVLGL